MEEAEGAVGALVNNAGYSQSGAVESVPARRVRAQFETNVFGLVADVPARAARACAARGAGRIVNVSSMGGKLTFPGGGVYHATKHAVEAISDAMRFELRGFGIQVVVIEPGLIKTSFAETVAGAMPDGGGALRRLQHSRSPRPPPAPTRAPWHGSGQVPRPWRSAISKALTARRPKTRYPVTASARLLLTQRKLMPDRAWDADRSGTSFRRPGA